MIVQACINGARSAGFHPLLPITAEAMAEDGKACTAAGAAELHLHARLPDGRESLSAVGATVLAVRRACPGTFIGVSTAAWIENDPERTREAISIWEALPDHASVNLSEADAPAVMELLRNRGVGIEAGLASVTDAERLVDLSHCHRVLRVLIEIEDQNPEPAARLAEDIAAVLDRAGLRRPVLLHGFEATVWPLVEMARRRRWSTRIGLEDGKHLPDGTIARGNAELVAAAVAIYRAAPSG